MTQRRAGADPVWKAWVHGRWYTGAWHRKASRQMGQLACGGDGDGGGRCPGTGRDHRRGKGQRACGSTRRGGAHHLTSAVEVVRAILCLELRDAQLVYIMSRQPRGGEQHQAQNKGSRDQEIKIEAFFSNFRFLPPPSSGLPFGPVAVLVLFLGFAVAAL